MTMRRDYRSLSHKNISREIFFFEIENIFQQTSTFSRWDATINYEFILRNRRLLHQRFYSSKKKFFFIKKKKITRSWKSRLDAKNDRTIKRKWSTRDDSFLERKFHCLILKDCDLFSRKSKFAVVRKSKFVNVKKNNLSTRAKKNNLVATR
jgi:hypothetical protein